MGAILGGNGLAAAAGAVPIGRSPISHYEPLLHTTGRREEPIAVAAVLLEGRLQRLLRCTVLMMS